MRQMHTKSLLIRLLIGSVALLFLLLGGAIWILNAGRVIGGDWTIILPIVCVVLTVALTLLMWLFPFSPVDTTKLREISFSTPPTQASQSIPSLLISEQRQVKQAQGVYSIPY